MSKQAPVVVSTALFALLLAGCDTATTAPELTATTAAPELTATTAQSVERPGAEKFPLVGPRAIIFCATLEPFPGEIADELQGGFVVFNLDRQAGVLKATVSLKRAAPNTDYPVRLIQDLGAGQCFAVNGVLSTNRVGNGTLHLEEPAEGTRAQVIVDSRVRFGTPTYRATEIYHFFGS